MAIEQTMREYLAERGLSQWNLDHTMLSPSGKASGAARRAIQQRFHEAQAASGQAMREYYGKIDSGEIVDPTGEYKPVVKPTEAERLLEQAARFELWAQQGITPRKCRKKAAELRAEAERL